MFNIEVSSCVCILWAPVADVEKLVQSWAGVTELYGNYAMTVKAVQDISVLRGCLG